MKYVFSEADKQQAYKQKRNLWLFWIGVLVLFLAIEAVLITVDAVEVATTRTRRYDPWFMILGIVIAALFAAFSLFFFSIKFRLTRKYVKMLKDMDSGLRDTTTGKFIEVDESITDKDGVFFYSLMFECTPLKRGDITTRKVLLEKTQPRPDMMAGDRVRFTTHANILICYEFLSRVPRPEPETQEAADTLAAEAQDE